MGAAADSDHDDGLRSGRVVAAMVAALADQADVVHEHHLADSLRGDRQTPAGVATALHTLAHAIEAPDRRDRPGCLADTCRQPLPIDRTARFPAVPLDRDRLRDWLTTPADGTGLGAGVLSHTRAEEMIEELALGLGVVAAIDGLDPGALVVLTVTSVPTLAWGDVAIEAPGPGETTSTS